MKLVTYPPRILFAYELRGRRRLDGARVVRADPCPFPHLRLFRWVV